MEEVDLSKKTGYSYEDTNTTGKEQDVVILHHIYIYIHDDDNDDNDDKDDMTIYIDTYLSTYPEVPHSRGGP